MRRQSTSSDGKNYDDSRMTGNFALVRVICCHIAVTVTSPKMYDCTAATTTAHPLRAPVPTASSDSLPSLYLLGPAVFDPTDDDALSCPLVINAAEGQHINLTLYDFGVQARREHIPDDYSAYDQVQSRPPCYNDL